MNRIKGLCAIHGIYDYAPMRPDRTRRLDQLRTGDGRALPPRLKAEIARELQRLELVLRMLKEIDAERNAIASARVSAHTNAKKIQDLVKLKAIGPEIATVLAGEVFYRRFNNRRELASYVGLTPSHLQSGPTCRVSTGTEVSLNVGFQFSLGGGGFGLGISRGLDRGFPFREDGRGAFALAVG